MALGRKPLTDEVIQAREIRRFTGKVLALKEADCWPWQAGFSGLYGTFRVRVNGRWKDDGAHRVAWRLAFGDIPDGLWVLHNCDNPACCNPSHLFLGTQQVNIQDAVNKGRNRGGSRKGSQNHASKLKESDVVCIREHIALGILDQHEIGALFNVTNVVISQIKRGVTWKHV